MDWRPSQPNGWWSKFSPSGRRVLYGNGHVFVALLDRSPIVELDIAAGWHYGWLDEQTIVYAVPQDSPRDTAIQHRVTIAPDGTWADGLTGCPAGLASGNWYDANDGHWVTALGARICLDGVVIATDGGGAAKTASGRVIWPCVLNKGTPAEVWGIRIWTAGQIVDFVPLAGANSLTFNRDGYIGYGYWGPSYLRWPDGTQREVTVTPWRTEGPPVVVRDPAGVDWLWCATADPVSGRLMVVGHPIGETACLIIYDQAGISLSVRCVDGKWRVAGCGDRGELHVQDIDADAPRVALASVATPIDEPIVPVVLPAYPEPKWIGWWAAYGRAASMYQGPSHPEAPANCALCGPADMDLVPAGVPLMFGCTDASRDLAIPLWNRVAGLIAYADMSDRQAAQAEVERQAADALAWMDAHALTHRPIWSYTAGHVIEAAGVDWNGVQCYFEQAVTDQAWAAFWANVVAQVSPTCRFALIGQAYSRVDAYWQQRPHALANLQRHFARTLADPRVCALFPFAWARGNLTIPDGAIFQPLIAAWYQAIVSAVATPTIVTAPPPAPVPEGLIMPDVFLEPTTPFMQTGWSKRRVAEPFGGWLEHEIALIRHIIADEFPWRTPPEREALMPQGLTLAIIYSATSDQIRANFRQSQEWKTHH